jgi:4-hydroxy-tetrahydrodipicolinate reductase
MGKEVALAVSRNNQQAKSASIVGGIVSANEPCCGKHSSEMDCLLSHKWEESFSAANVIIDFSSAEGAKLALEIATKQGIPALICSTGIGPEMDALFEEASKKVRIIRTSNTSVGVTAALKLVKEAARLLGEGFDVEISEIHHKQKKDAPSGTALSLAESVASALPGKLSDRLITARTGKEALRNPGEIGVSALRGGDVPGEHTVFFFGMGERIEITHRALNRSIWADGALRAASWLTESSKSPGIYSMFDVLG